MTPIMPGDPTMVSALWLGLAPLIVVLAVFARLSDF